jgi:hypothetical protein
MIQLPQLEGVFEVPRLMFTLDGKNPRSVAVLDRLRGMNGSTLQCRAFASEDEVGDFFRNSGISPAASVVLWDANLGHKHFRPTGRNRTHEVSLPPWAHGAQWVVMVGKDFRPEGCARQIHADFVTKFTVRLASSQFPWGPGKMTDRGRRLREQPPTPVVMPATIYETVSRLNAGPDLAAAIADKAFAAELPQGSRISWLRILPEPIGCDTALLERILKAMRWFEEVSGSLLRSDADVARLILSGVELPSPSPLADAYLFPRVKQFSVGRPDLHYVGSGLPFASEIDEMPGGMPELVHIDVTYGINAKRWEKAFNWLCKDGPLVFLVSSQWSKCYIPETAWLVGHLQELGYPVKILTTDKIDEIEFRAEGLFLGGERIGTIWRQFPIFETRGKVADVVMAAHEGRVRLVPEFAHFGNKSWFSVFRSHEAFYRSAMDGATFQLLSEVLPQSYIVGELGGASFPIVVDSNEIRNVAELKRLPEEMRNRIVLKVCGANNLAARSYGVLMGNGIDAGEWAAWIDERLRAEQPFIVQHRLESGVVRLPVLNSKTNLAELFSCRILARPWSVNEELVSMHGCAVPSYLFRVHGMVDMAVVPFVL